MISSCYEHRLVEKKDEINNEHPAMMSSTKMKYLDLQAKDTDFVALLKRTVHSRGFFLLELQLTLETSRNILNIF